MRGLKIFTVICYCIIIIPATHFAAPLLVILIASLDYGDAPALISSVLIFFILIYFLRSGAKPKRKRDLYFFIIGGLILFIPLVRESIWLRTYAFENFYEDPFFFCSSLPFIILLPMTIVRIFRSKIPGSN